MSDEQVLSRPIGWWLKRADVLLDAAFDAELEAEEVDRRARDALRCGWSRGTRSYGNDPHPPKG